MSTQGSRSLLLRQPTEPQKPVFHKPRVTQYLPWIIGGIALWVIAIALLLQVMLSGPQGTGGLRRSLNDTLRGTLTSLGILPEQRRIEETRELMLDANGSWKVLNWNISVATDFDIDTARVRLQGAVESSGAKVSVRFDRTDPFIPLVLYAHVGDRLSHRLFFIRNGGAAQKTSDPSPEGGARGREADSSAAARSLEWKLLGTMKSMALNGPTLLIREYDAVVEGDESGELVPHWIISVAGGKGLDEVAAELRGRLPDLTLGEPIRGETLGEAHLTFMVAGEAGARRALRLTTHPDCRGLRLLRLEREDSAFISKPRVALIIDDIGFDLEIAEELAALDAPLTLSILPHQRFSTEIALRSYRRSREVMLHLPMEPNDANTNPGIGAIRTSQSADEVRRRTIENIQAVPHVTGVNNHMGSKAMADAEVVAVVLRAIKESDLFFVDSRTAQNTVGYRIAVEMGIPCARKTVFIDAEEDGTVETRIGWLEKLIEIAGIHGSAVGIGHPGRDTLEAIRQMLPRFRESGVELVFVSDIVS